MDSPKQFFQGLMIAIGFLVAGFLRFTKLFGGGLDDSVKELISDIDHRQTALEKNLAVWMAEVRGKFALLTTRIDSLDDELKRETR